MAPAGERNSSAAGVVFACRCRLPACRRRCIPAWCPYRRCPPSGQSTRHPGMPCTAPAGCAAAPVPAPGLRCGAEAAAAARRRWFPPRSREAAAPAAPVGGAGCAPAPVPAAEHWAGSSSARQRSAGTARCSARSAVKRSLPAERTEHHSTPVVPARCPLPGQRSVHRPAPAAPCRSAPVQPPRPARAPPASCRWSGWSW